MDERDGQLEMRSAVMLEMLVQQPSWLLKWGISVVGVLLCLLMGAAWFLPYPDVVRVPAKVVRINAPQAGFSLTQGTSSHLAIKERKQIKLITASVAEQALRNRVPLTYGYYCELALSPANARKVRIGQEVMLKLDGYPPHECGSIPGRISRVALTPSTDGTTPARVRLPNGLSTNYNKKLPFRIGMSANADIVITDVRLIDKFFSQFRKISK